MKGNLGLEVMLSRSIAMLAPRPVPENPGRQNCSVRKGFRRRRWNPRNPEFRGYRFAPERRQIRKKADFRSRMIQD